MHCIWGRLFLQQHQYQISIEPALSSVLCKVLVFLVWKLSFQEDETVENILLITFITPGFT